MLLSTTVQREFQPITAPTCREDEYADLSSGSEITFHWVKSQLKDPFAKEAPQPIRYSATYWMTAILQGSTDKSRPSFITGSIKARRPLRAVI